MLNSHRINSQLTTPTSLKVSFADKKVFVEQFSNSGMHQQAFCELHNLNRSIFKNWVYRYKFRANLANHQQPVFVPISLGDVDDYDVSRADLAKTNVSQTNLVTPSNVSAAPSTISLTHNCDHRLTISCAQLSIVVPVGFDTKYLRQVLAMVVDL